MVTTRRSAEIMNSTYEPCAAVAGVDLLDRPEVYQEQASVQDAVKTQAEADRRRNLEKLLNYDRYTEQASAVIAPEKEETEQVQASALADEDIRPTSTTMQFGDDIDQIRREMNRAESKEHEGYHLNGKGKIAITLYALAVTVILALIVLNTGVLASLSNVQDAKAAKLNETMTRYEAIQQEIEDMSSAEHIIDVAQNEYGMIMGN